MYQCHMGTNGEIFAEYVQPVMSRNNWAMKEGNMWQSKKFGFDLKRMTTDC